MNPDNELRIAAISVEVIKRLKGVELYREQLLCAIALREGYIAEMKAGEGKTYAIILAAIIYSLYHKTYVVTVNDYLAERDSLLAGEICGMLGISVSFNKVNSENKAAIHNSDIIYSATSELVFDYLRDKELVKDFGAAIIDEVDFILIDNANSVCRVSEGGETPEEGLIFRYRLAKHICGMLSGIEVPYSKDGIDMYDYYAVDYVYRKADRLICITNRGIGKISGMLKHDVTKDREFFGMILHTLDALHFFQNGVDYIVRDGKLQIINRENGRIMVNCTLEADIQTALEIKEDLNPTCGHAGSRAISYQLFFNKFANLVGVSGTTFGTNEFASIFGKAVVVIPTHNPQLRKHLGDKIFKTLREKYDYLAELISSLAKEERAILIVASSDRQSEEVRDLLKNNGICCTLLNNLNPEEEKDIIDSAGMKGSVTVSTNIVGRGTDILIDSVVNSNGGLFLVSLNRNFNGRVDRQVIGRVGRQGCRGESIFLVSFEDPLFDYVYAEEKEYYLNLPNETFYSDRIQKKIGRLIDHTQKRVTSNLERYRKFNYEFETAIESFKQGWFEDRQKFIPMVCRFVVQRKAQQVFRGKVLEVGAKNVLLMLQEIIRYCMDIHWDMLRIAFDHLKTDVFMEASDSKTVSSEFVRKAYGIMKEEEKRLAADVFHKFLSVEIISKGRAGEDNG